jgi:DNA-binding NtrC family response regulator
MTEEKLQSEYRELLASKVPMAVLKDCLQAKIVVCAMREFGRNDRAGAALGVCDQTISRWNVANRKLTVDQQLQATLLRVAQSLFHAERAAQQATPEASANGALPRMVAAFDTGMTAVAMESTKGNKKAAARLLGVHRNWVLKNAGSRRSA